MRVRAAWYKASSKNASNYKTDLENRLNISQYNKIFLYVIMGFVLITKITFVPYIIT